MRIGGECDIDGCNLRHIYGSTLCFKHTRILREEGHKVMSPEEVPWWEEGGVATEGGEEGDSESLEYCEDNLKEEDTEMHPVGYIVGAGYLWFVFQSVIDSDGELLGLLASDIGIAIAFAPLWLINKIFQRRISDVEEESEEPTTNIREAGTNSSLARKQLIATTIVMAIGFLLPWRLGGWEWGQTFNGLEELRWAPSELSFWLFDARDLFYGITTTEWLSIVIRSALPLVFLLTFASTWYMHLRGKDSFSRTASRIHLYVFGLWYTLVFLGWGMTFPSEYDIGLYITAVAGIGLDTTPDGIMSKYIRRDG